MPGDSPTPEAKIQALDRVLNVLMHADWPELHRRWAGEAEDMQRAMNDASTWEQFVAARAVRCYIVERLLTLHDLVTAEKAELENIASSDLVNYEED